MPIMRVCLEARCRAVIPASMSRCPAHTVARQRERDAVRGSAAQRGYDAVYRRNRAAVLASGPHPCAWGCGRVATTVDHVVPLARGGDSGTGNLMPSCKSCNSSRGARPAPSWWGRRGAR
jgi:5-methylcytosine-specific restriction protein A